MNKSIKKFLVRLEAFQRERKSLLRRLTVPIPYAVGSVSIVHRKCGQPTCHCINEGGHLQTLFLFRRSNQNRRCKLVRKADADRLLKAGQNYRNFRYGLRRLRAIHFEEKKILMAILRVRAIIYD